MNFGKHKTVPHRVSNTYTGIALVIVLWILTLLSAIAASLISSTRTEISIASYQVSAAIAESLADAGVARAIFELAQPSSTDAERWKADALTRTWRYQDATILVSIIDESGKIDLNSAPVTLLAGLFASAGLDNAEAVADAVLDWRDADDLRSPLGAEKADYLAAGRREGPANAPFEVIEELRQVLGVTEDAYRTIEDAITVHSYQPGLNTTLAPRAALLALPSVTTGEVDAFLEQRQSLLQQGQPAIPFSYAATQAVPSASPTATYSILVRVILDDNTQYIREAVIRSLGNVAEPPAVVAWRSLTQSK